MIVPQLKAGKSILVAAHGNSLRGIVKHLDNMSDEAIMGCNLPTGIPFVYELDADLKVSWEEAKAIISQQLKQKWHKSQTESQELPYNISYSVHPHP